MSRPPTVARSVLPPVVVAAVLALAYRRTGEPAAALGAFALVMVALQTWRRARPTGLATQLNRTGRIVAALGVVGVAMGRVDVLLTSVVCLLVGAVTARRAVQGVTVGAGTPPVATAGEVVPVDLRVSGGRGPVTVRALDPVGDAHVVDGHGAGVVLHLSAHRGVYAHLRVLVAGTGWLGLVETARVDLVTLDAPIVVLPRARHVPVPAPPLAEPAPNGDGPTLRRAGQAGTVRSVRPYVPGDPRQRVHWPTSARTGRLAVRELDQPARAAVRLAVDLPPVPDPATRSEAVAWHRAVDRITGEARFVAEQLLRQGVPVRLVTLEGADPFPDAPTVAVDQPVADARAAAVRLARARPGLAHDGDADTWRVGPEPGRVRTGGSGGTSAGTPRTSAPAVDPTVEASDRGHDDGFARRVSGAVTAVAIVPAIVALLASRQDLSPALVLLAPPILTLVVVHALLDRVPRPAMLAVTAAYLAGASFALTAPPVRTDWILPVAVAWLVGRAVVTDAARRWHLGHGCDMVQGEQPIAAELLAAAWLATAVLVDPPLSSMAAVVVAVVGALVLGAARLESQPRLDGSPARVDRARQVVHALVVAAVVVALLPLASAGRERLQDLAGRAGAGGGTGAPSEGNPTSADVAPWVYGRDRLDAGSRPRPSDAEMLWVETDRPQLLRGQTFDSFDGRHWTSSQLAPAGTVPADGRVAPLDPTSIAPGGVAVDQRITVRADFATVLYGAAEPVRVRLPEPVVQTSDGSLFALDPLRRGDTYDVTSTLPAATAASLRASADLPVPAAVLERYASPPAVSARVASWVEQATSGAATPYDQVVALQSRLAQTVSYSLDAPLPPLGVDVVDHFLFEARAGWCEQIASTLTLGLRHLGTPARLATGFAPGEWDRGAGHFVVRARDAHAWVEVWFPGVGWQGFDPTTAVPLGGEPAAPLPEPSTLDPRALVIVGMGGLLVAGVLLVSRRRRGHTADPGTAWDPWVAEADARLRRIGDTSGVPRSPTEGAAVHGRRLARRLGDDRLAAIGRAIEHDAYGPGTLPPDVRAEVDATLTEVAGTLAPVG